MPDQAGDVERLRELAERATPGPWRVYVSAATLNLLTEDNRVVAYVDDFGAEERKHDADAEFIAAARNLLPALLDERDADKAEIERLRAIIEATRRVPVGTEREALWRRAERNKASKPWRTVWHLLRSLGTVEAERDALQRAAEAQRVRYSRMVGIIREPHTVADAFAAVLAAAGAPQEGTQR